MYVYFQIKNTGIYTEDRDVFFFFMKVPNFITLELVEEV